jgi:spermidine/putrescine transport system substrate-binding protein
MRRKSILAILALFAVLVFCPPASHAEEQTLRMLIWEGYAPEEHRTAFIKLVKEKYDVDLKLDVKYVNGNDDFFPALKKGETDIFSPSHPVPKDERWQLIQLKLALPLNLENIPNYKNVIPSLQKADYCTEGGEVYAVPHVRGPYGLAYNTSLMKEEPKTWNVLWNPKYKGKYTLGKDAYVHNVSITALAMGIPPNDMNNYRKLNTPAFQKKLGLLAANSAPMWEGVDTPESLKGLSLAVVWGFSLPGLKEQGETWRIAEPEEGTTGWVDNFMISHTLENNPKLRRIAEEWLNYVLSDDYQVYDVRGLACAPVTETVKDKLTLEEVRQFHLDDPGHFEKNRILWKILDKQDRKGLQRLWTKAIEEAE